MFCSFLKESNRQPSQGEIEEEINYVVSGTVVNRSFLSDEMANMCAKLPIFRVKPKNFMVDVEKETRLHSKLNCNCFK